ncbi:MAG TPA: glycosyltransferase family 1 protein [Plantibacter sp.]|uniref:glycosyltransferase family 4 protein n=1 Tax=Plantibacter sp. TaxID=1871045 RepID=UPI002C4D263E|nr:glycosyltransferase family 1 protein [Plantibacter sp.]
MPRVAVDLLSYTGTKGGMETYARELYREVGRQGNEFEFIGLASSEGYQLDHSWFPGEVVDTGISGENRFIWAFGELFQVARHAKRHGADLIHSPATLGPARSSMPTVVTMHDMLYWSNPELMTTPLYTAPVKFMERLASKNAARVLTISEVSRTEIEKYLHVPRARIDLVPLAGTMPSIDGERDPDRQRPFVLATGNRRPHKNWASLIRALPLLAEHERPHLVITGSHGDDPLRAVVEETGMQDWVELKGWLTSEELGELYRRATIMAMPSFVDGFSLPALESMMVGLPVMMSDIPVYHEVCGEAALYLDPNSLDSIAATMRTAVTQPDELERLAAAGLERAAAFSWARTASATLESFRTALGR